MQPVATCKIITNTTICSKSFNFCGLIFIICFAGGKCDHSLVSSNIYTITSHLNDLALGLHQMSSLMNDAGADNLMKVNVAVVFKLID